MKNITEYFTSPIKSNSKSNEKKTAHKEPAVQAINNDNKDKECEIVEKAVSKNTKKGKKKKKRKVSDPMVKDVTDLLSNNLSLISPNTSGIESVVSQTLVENSVESNGTNVDVGMATNILAENSSPVKNANKVDTSKVNAFQFLMNSRNNIIGQNSDGKIVQEQSSSPDESKEKLSSRKKLFESWVNQKGATKRRREEEEIENCISYKMQKRAKRLRNMLQRGKEPKVIETEEVETVVRKKPVKRIISSESESSNDATMKKPPPELKDISVIIEENSQDGVKVSSKSKKQNVSSSLLNFIGVKEKEHLKVFDEDDTGSDTTKIIKLKMFTPKSTKIQIPVKKSDKKENRINKIKRPKEAKLNESLEEFGSDANINTGKKDNKKVKDKKKTRKSVISKKMKESLSEETYSEMLGNDNIISSKKTSKQSEGTAISNTINHLSQNNETLLLSEVNSPKRCLRTTRKTINYNEVDDIIIKVETSEKQDQKKPDQSNISEKIELSSDSDSEKINQKPVKVAPVFLKLAPKPKVDPEILEARKKFLMSGIPDSLRKTVEKQKSFEEIEYNIFPLISHVEQKCDSKFWDLPKTTLNLRRDSPLLENTYELKCNNIINKVSSTVKLQVSESKFNLEKVLNNIKINNPNYPVYKFFRHISGKNGLPSCKETQLKKSTRKKTKRGSRKSTEVPDNKAAKDESNKFLMWTEKYRPCSSEEILGNNTGVSALKGFLEIWMNYSQEINARGKRKRGESNSESEFDLTDCDSRDSVRLPGNTIILTGPCGSGKTTAVYAIAKELGFNVLEVNASKKRTGKKLIQELHEATQSHQVRKHKIGSLNLDGQDKKVVDSNGKEHKKMCILLVEDVDVVFDQDEGFLGSLSQLILTSKRPIILTTTDPSPAHVQKFVNQYECINFLPLYKPVLDVWLQIVCLVEGWLVDKNELGNLLDCNNGDIRKTLLSIQYWCQSGGQLRSDYTSPLYILSETTEENEVTLTDHEMKTEIESKVEPNFIHSQCLGSFEVFSEEKQFKIPRRFDLGKIWWNIPNIINARYPSERLNRWKWNDSKINHENEDHNHPYTSFNLSLLSNLYDSLVLTDELYRSVKYSCDEPIMNNWSMRLKDSLELTEKSDDIMEDFSFVQDFSHTLINGYIDEYQRVNHLNSGIDLAVSSVSEKRWRNQQHSCENFLKQPIPLSNSLDHSSISLDYLPALRHIARSENRRAASNTKRGNRFRHYLKNLDLNFSHNKSKLCCGVLNLGYKDL